MSLMMTMYNNDPAFHSYQILLWHIEMYCKHLIKQVLCSVFNTHQLSQFDWMNMINWL